MKMKQKNLRIFEIECLDYSESISYLQKNAELLLSLPIALKGGSAAKVCDWALANSFCAFVAPECLGETKKQPAKIKTSLFDEEPDVELARVINKQPDIKTQIINDIEKIEQEIKAPIEVAPTPKASSGTRLVINRVLRSGENIQNDGDVVVFGRVNSGAKVISGGCVEIFEEIDGLVECEGEYMIIRSIGKGSVVFKNETVKKESLIYDLNRLFFENAKLQIKKV